MRPQLLWVLAVLMSLAAGAAHAQPAVATLQGLVPSPDQPQEMAAALKLLLGLSVLSLAPALLVMLTCFTRIIIVLSFLRSALGTQQTPPNAILAGLALFLTFYIMYPTWEQVNERAVRPYMQGKLRFEAAIVQGAVPVRGFLLRQTRQKDIALFLNLGRLPRPAGPDEIPMRALVPAFILSELRSGFQIGFVLFIPFVVVDLVVASVLMSMGMMMLPPVMISLPTKILLFVMVDGWHLITQSLVLSFA
ncbi:MAG: flagellar type III secretion system pore protein FliP [Armatimonadetes bacterium]|nr:flagellar type III secretion system pore protein FliP [Armatimonadota bacterium]